MSWTLKFFRSVSWPAESASSTNGGAIDTANELTGAAHEIFGASTSAYLGGSTRTVYRKIFVRNDDAATMTDVKVFLAEAEYAGMFQIAVEKSASDTSTSPQTIPSGYIAGDFVNADGQANALAKIVGGTSMAVGASMGVWIKYTVPAGLQEADSYVPVNLVVIGVR